MTALVTGAGGFVGSALVQRLASDRRCRVRASSRRASTSGSDGVEWVVGPELGPDADWRAQLAGVDVVVHLAARVHVMAGSGRMSDTEFRRVNTEGTRRLAEQAAAAGVRRLIFLSTVKVHGEAGLVNEDSPALPCDAYAASKRDAEAAIREVARTTGLEVVIVRPPLVYGPGVKANVEALVTAVRRGLPLPLGAIRNRRSLVGVDNLVDLIVVCLDHPAAASRAFLVSDGDDVATPELVRRLADALGCRARLWPVPVWCLRLAATVLGRSDEVSRLTGSFCVDISTTRRVIGWTPPVTMADGLARMVRR
jgi:nucleoside-diphosphate-sugar epimerase